MSCTPSQSVCKCSACISLPSRPARKVAVDEILLIRPKTYTGENRVRRTRGLPAALDVHNPAVDDSQSSSQDLSCSMEALCQDFERLADAIQPGWNSS